MIIRGERERNEREKQSTGVKKARCEAVTDGEGRTHQDRATLRPTNRHTKRLTDRQTNRLTDKQADRQTG